MTGAGWVDLIRRIPLNLHNVLSFALVNGMEIMTQDIMRLEESHVVLRGRLSGTQDAGRIIVLPFDQVVNIALNKQLKDEDVQAIFGAAPALAAAREMAADSPDALDAEADSPEQEEIAAPLKGVPLDTAARLAAPTRPENPKPAPVSKSLLLDRLRQRLAEQGKQS